MKLTDIKESEYHIWYPIWHPDGVTTRCKKCGINRHNPFGVCPVSNEEYRLKELLK